MTDKERLEEIKNVCWENLRTSQILHVKWLIEQAERAQELEKANKTLSDNHFQQIEQHKYLVQQNKGLHEALRETLHITEDIKDIWRVKE